MPIMYSNKPNKVLGVFQLVNKFENLPFTKNDENFVEAFAIFCGMGIHNVHMYEKTVLAMAKQQVTLEVLRYVLMTLQFLDVYKPCFSLSYYLKILILLYFFVKRSISTAKIRSISQLLDKPYVNEVI